MRIFNNIIFFTALVLVFLNSCDQKPSVETPNVIFILTDDLGFQDLSSYGSPMIKTPNLDVLAKQGALLN